MRIQDVHDTHRAAARKKNEKNSLVYIGRCPRKISDINLYLFFEFFSPNEARRRQERKIREKSKRDERMEKLLKHVLVFEF